MSDLKITIEQLKNYLGTGLKFELQINCHDDFVDLEHYSEFQKAFSKGALWDFVGWTDIELPLDEGEFDGELLQYEKGIYKGNYRDSKPIFYPISALNKFIPELGFVPRNELLKLELGSLPKSLDFNWLYFHQINQLFQWHFWPFGDEYFEQGLVINKMKHGKEEANEKT